MTGNVKVDSMIR